MWVCVVVIKVELTDGTLCLRSLHLTEQCCLAQPSSTPFLVRPKMRMTKVDYHNRIFAPQLHQLAPSNSALPSTFHSNCGNLTNAGRVPCCSGSHTHIAHWKGSRRAHRDSNLLHSCSAIHLSPMSHTFALHLIRCWR